MSKLLQAILSSKSITQKLGVFHISFGIDLDYLKLFLYAKSVQEKKNQILLPENFFNPLLATLSLTKSDKLKQSDFINKLNNFGYTKVEQIYNSFQFSSKGDTYLVYTNIADLVYRIEFFDDVIEKIVLLDNVSFRFIKEVKNIVLLNYNPAELAFKPLLIGEYEEYNTSPIVYLSSLPDSPTLKQLKSKEKFTKSIPLFHRNSEVFNLFTRDYPDYDFYYVGHFKDIIPVGFLVFQNKKLNIESLNINLEKGFISEELKIIVLTDYEILSTLNLSQSESKKFSKFNKLFDSNVNIDDYIVHDAHGIGIYKGIESRVVLGKINDYAIVEYQDNDKLLIPLNQISRLSKYISADNSSPKITKLGTAEWESVRRKLKKAVEEIAKELLEIYAKKSLEKGIEFEKDSKVLEKFEEMCEFDLTEDQIRTLSEVKNDMESPKPMDRLIIGDVGFGKTEIALRAAYKAVLSGKQVLILAPTTVLVAQLFNVFHKRLHSEGVSIARVSRFDGTKNNKANIEKANNGQLDIIIGTHRLLSNDVNLPNLGLLIIDEEQRFGVKQKEKIRKLRTNIDLLAMSATPIPRTLQMALTGIKDISIIATPPKNRLAVKSEVIFIEEITEKILFEVNRKGQVFIVHNKIEDIDTFAMNLKQELNENIKIITAHGRMKAEKLEQIMYDFSQGKYDILIATTIIENGIDIPNVNTMIIDNAHEFGLSQLYQLRGRVGRSNIQGYCYLIVPKVKEFIKLHKNPDEYSLKLKKLLEENKIEDRWLTPDSVSRVTAIIENQELGAGFKIASRDLEIRGSGNILGSEQSGQINAVGYEMYIRLLEQEIDRIRKISTI